MHLEGHTVLVQMQYLTKSKIEGLEHPHLNTQTAVVG